MVTVCGRVAKVPTPTRQAVAEWAHVANDATTFKEVIASYAPGAAHAALTATQQPEPACDWTFAGNNWRTTQETLHIGDEARTTVLTSADGTDSSYNYETVVRSGDLLVICVLNVPHESRALADALCRVAWRKALRAKIAHA